MINDLMIYNLLIQILLGLEYIKLNVLDSFQHVHEFYQKQVD